MATAGGAAALGRDDLGVIAPGAKADLLVVDMRQPHLFPVWDPLRALVWNGSGADVSAVMVDGEILVRDGIFLHADANDIMDRAARALDSCGRSRQRAVCSNVGPAPQPAADAFPGPGLSGVRAAAAPSWLAVIFIAMCSPPRWLETAVLRPAARRTGSHGSAHRSRVHEIADGLAPRPALSKSRGLATRCRVETQRPLVQRAIMSPRFTTSAARGDTTGCQAPSGMRTSSPPSASVIARTVSAP